MISKIENYYLNQNIKEALDLMEYTSEEYQMFELSGYTKMLNDEKIFHGKRSNLNGNFWDTVIGSTNGKIYRISLQIMDTNKKRIDSIFKSTLYYLIEEMGKYSEHKLLSKRYIWDVQEGNVIYEMLSKCGYHCINIFFTSSTINNQVKNYFKTLK